MKNPLYEFCKKNPEIKKQSIAESLGISKQLLSYWLKQKGEKFTVELTEKIKKLRC